MLLRFSAANHLSLNSRQELSLVASSALKDRETGLIACAAAPGGRLLPAAVIYGANASGKSNVVDALRWMREQILASHPYGEPGGGVPRSPFALDPELAAAPSAFEADFVAEGVRYHYGFEASERAFTAEWLDAFPKARRQVLFSREGEGFFFGRGLSGRNKVISDLTRPNSLFVSAALQNDHMMLSGVFYYIIQAQLESSRSSVTKLSFSRGRVENLVIDFVKQMGTGIVDYRLKNKDLFSDDEDDEQITSYGSRLASAGFSKWQRSDIEFAHQGSDGKLVYFDPIHESDGTQRMLGLLPAVFRALKWGTLLVVDELDASLHTQACEAVLALFSSPRTNPKGAQLIATTHDTNLLHSPLLRRDQIWFTEKDAEGATHLYPLTDIRTRKGDNIEKGYLQGRYGAIPFAGRALDLVTGD